LQSLDQSQERFAEQGRDQGVNEQGMRHTPVEDETVDRVIIGNEDVQIRQGAEHAADQRRFARADAGAENCSGYDSAERELGYRIHPSIGTVDSTKVNIRLETLGMDFS